MTSLAASTRISISRGCRRRVRRKSGKTGPSPRQYSLYTRFQDTGELFKFKVPHCRGQTLIGELKDSLELVAGIPSNLQRLSYLDEGDLPNSSTLCFNDIVPGAVITLRVWHYDGWMRLVKAAVEGDVERLKAVGVTAADSSFSTPNSLQMNAVQRAVWVSQRASCALYISAHRGHHGAVCFLLQNGADVRLKTPLGLTALHVAAAWGRSQCIDELLKHGANIFSEDRQEATAMDYAARHGQKTSIRQLHMFKWKLRSSAGRTKSLPDPEECSENQKNQKSPEERSENQKSPEERSENQKNQKSPEERSENQKNQKRAGRASRRTENQKSPEERSENQKSQKSPEERSENQKNQKSPEGRTENQKSPEERSENQKNQKSPEERSENQKNQKSLCTFPKKRFGILKSIPA
ncbi:stress response protein NST1-like [Huso huso]|uniref:Stress response protein NST1-like n=1 Tax=Huso huso TaxID=61971 RepID=A0ABR0YGB5_HUSHU